MKDSDISAVRSATDPLTFRLCAVPLLARAIQEAAPRRQRQCSAGGRRRWLSPALRGTVMARLLPCVLVLATSCFGLANLEKYCDREAARYAQECDNDTCPEPFIRCMIEVPTCRDIIAGMQKKCPDSFANDTKFSILRTCSSDAPADMFSCWNNVLEHLQGENQTIIPIKETFNIRSYRFLYDKRESQLENFRVEGGSNIRIDKKTSEKTWPGGPAPFSANPDLSRPPNKKILEMSACFFWPNLQFKMDFKLWKVTIDKTGRKKGGAAQTGAIRLLGVVAEGEASTTITDARFCLPMSWQNVVERLRILSSGEGVTNVVIPELRKNDIIIKLILENNEHISVNITRAITDLKARDRYYCRISARKAVTEKLESDIKPALMREMVTFFKFHVFPTLSNVSSTTPPPVGRGVDETPSRRYPGRRVSLDEILGGRFRPQGNAFFADDFERIYKKSRFSNISK